MSWLRRFDSCRDLAFHLFLTLVLSLVIAPLRGQGSADFLVKAYSTLLEVRVLDSGGNPVEGLKEEDFQIKAGSQVRPLLFFEERKNSNVSLVILVDIGSSMSEDSLRTAKESIFELIHLLDPEDEIAIAVYDRKVEFLSDLTSDRLELLESTRNIPVGGRTGFWKRLGSGFGTSALTGYAVDEALLHLKKARHNPRVVLAFSSAFGNLGPGTEEHLAISGARFFGVEWSNRLGNAFNLWGDRLSRGSMLSRSGGVLYSGKSIKERIDALARALQNYYLMAYDPVQAEAGIEDEPEPQIRVASRPDCRLAYLRRIDSQNAFY